MKNLKLPAAVTGIFDLMGTAEDEIAAALETETDAKKRVGINGAFRYLCPPPGMTTLDERVYRAHARELVERCRNGAKLDDGTKAEVMVALSQMSLVAPPSAQYAALYERLFAEIFEQAVPGDAAREPWPKASDELLADLRRKVGRERARSAPAEKRSGVKPAGSRAPAK